MKKDLTAIAVIVDRSGSMGGKEGDVIGGYNRLLDDQAKDPGETRVTLVQFDDRYEVNYVDVPVAEAKRLDEATYQPRGMTALLDAVGRTINELGDRLSVLPEGQRPAKVLVAIITDGLENASREFTHEKIKEMIKHQEEVYSWEFIFLGSDIRSRQEAQVMGIKLQNIAVNQPDGIGVQAAYVAASRGMTGYKCGVESVDMQSITNQADDELRSSSTTGDSSDGRVP
jgi:hypothetical protein